MYEITDEVRAEALAGYVEGLAELSDEGFAEEASDILYDQELKAMDYKTWTYGTIAVGVEGSYRRNDYKPRPGETIEMWREVSVVMREMALLLDTHGLLTQTFKDKLYGNLVEILNARLDAGDNPFGDE